MDFTVLPVLRLLTLISASQVSLPLWDICLFWRTWSWTWPTSTLNTRVSSPSWRERLPRRTPTRSFTRARRIDLKSTDFMSVSCALVVRPLVPHTGGTQISTLDQPSSCRHTDGSLTPEINTQTKDWSNYVNKFKIVRNWNEARWMSKHRHVFSDLSQRSWSTKGTPTFDGFGQRFPGTQISVRSTLKI